MNSLMFLSKPFHTDPRVIKEINTLLSGGHNVSLIFWNKYNECVFTDSVIGVVKPQEGVVFKFCSVNAKPFFGSSFLSNPKWCKEAYEPALRMHSLNKYDVVHCHDLDTLKIGVKLKKKLGVKLIYDCHDAIPFYFRSKTLSLMARKYEKKLLEHVDHIITVTEPMIEYLNTDKPITLVMNCCETIMDKYIEPDSDVFTVVYIGTMNRHRMFPEIVDIIGKMRDVRFIVGGRREALYDAVKKRCEQYDNVEFVGELSFEEVLTYILNSHAIISILQPDDENNKLTIPTKVFEAMAYGRASIVTDGMHYSKIVKENNCGVAVPYSKEGVMRAIEMLKENKMYKKLGINGIKVAKEKYNWYNEGKKLLQVYEELGD